MTFDDMEWADICNDVFDQYIHCDESFVPKSIQPEMCVMDLEENPSHSRLSEKMNETDRCSYQDRSKDYWTEKFEDLEQDVLEMAQDPLEMALPTNAHLDFLSLGGWPSPPVVPIAPFLGSSNVLDRNLPRPITPPSTARRRAERFAQSCPSAKKTLAAHVPCSGQVQALVTPVPMLTRDLGHAQLLPPSTGLPYANGNGSATRIFDMPPPPRPTVAQNASFGAQVAKPISTPCIVTSMSQPSEFQFFGQAFDANADLNSLPLDMLYIQSELNCSNASAPFDATFIESRLDGLSFDCSTDFSSALFNTDTPCDDPLPSTEDFFLPTSQPSIASQDENLYLRPNDLCNVPFTFPSTYDNDSGASSVFSSSSSPSRSPTPGPNSLHIRNLSPSPSSSSTSSCSSRKSSSLHRRRHNPTATATTKRSGSGGATNASGFVNYTPNDSSRILRGVAPSGSSKTMARRQREAAERRQALNLAAVRAVREAGGDVEVLRREAWI